MGAYTVVRGTIKNITKHEIYNHLSEMLGGIVSDGITDEDYSVDYVTLNGLPTSLEIIDNKENNDIELLASHKFQSYENAKEVDKMDSVILQMCQRLGDAEFSVSPYEYDMGDPDIIAKFEEENPNYYEEHHKVFPKLEERPMAKESFTFNNLTNYRNDMASFRYLGLIYDNMDKEKGTISNDVSKAIINAEKKANKYIDLLMSDKFDNKRTYYSICQYYLWSELNGKPDANQILISDFQQFIQKTYISRGIFNIPITDITDNEIKGLMWFADKEGNNLVKESLSQMLVERFDTQLIEEKAKQTQFLEKGTLGHWDKVKYNWGKSFPVVYGNTQHTYYPDSWERFDITFEYKNGKITLPDESKTELQNTLKRIAENGELFVLMKLCGKGYEYKGTPLEESMGKTNETITKLVLKGDIDGATNEIAYKDDIKQGIKENYKFYNSKYDNGIEDLVGKENFDKDVIFNQYIDECLTNYTDKVVSKQLLTDIKQVFIPLTVPYNEKDEFKDTYGKYGIKWNDEDKCWMTRLNVLLDDETYEIFDEKHWIPDTTKDIIDAYDCYNCKKTPIQDEIER